MNPGGTMIPRRQRLALFALLAVFLLMAPAAEARNRARSKRRRAPNEQNALNFMQIYLYCMLAGLSVPLIMFCWSVARDPLMPELAARAWEKGREHFSSSLSLSGKTIRDTGPSAKGRARKRKLKNVPQARDRLAHLAKI